MSDTPRTIVLRVSEAELAHRLDWLLTNEGSAWAYRYLHEVQAINLHDLDAARETKR